MTKYSGKNTILLVNGYNLSTYSTAYEATQENNPIEVTGFTDGCKNFIPGLRSGTITADMLWDSTAVSGTSVLFKSPGSTTLGNVTIIPEGYSVGCNSISMPYYQANYNPKTSPSTEVSCGTLKFLGKGAHFGLEHGWMLQHATITNTTTSTAVLDPSNAAVTAACSGTLHVWAACASDTYVVKIQHCATEGGVYADLVTFTLTGATLTSERVAVASGTINKYRKVVATRTGSAGNSFGFSVHFYHE